MIGAIMISVIMIGAIMMCVIMMSVIMFCAILMSVIMLSVIMLSVVAPFKRLKRKKKCFCLATNFNFSLFQFQRRLTKPIYNFDCPIYHLVFVGEKKDKEAFLQTNEIKLFWQ